MFESIINQTGISLERLAMLCEVAEAGSIGAATAGNANRQSQFSRQIAELEGFFGLELLDRRARPFGLTEAGRELAALARGSLGGLESFLARSKGEEERLVLGAGESFVQWLLLPATLSSPSEGVRFVFKNLDTNRIIEGIKAGQLDMGFVRANAVPEGFRCSRRFDFGYQLFVPKKLLPKRGPHGAAMLAEVPLALMEGLGEMRGVIESVAAAQGKRLSIAVECSSYPQIATAVAAGRCAGVLPSFAAGFLPKDVVAVELGKEASKQLTRRMCLVWLAKTELIKPKLAAEVAKLGSGMDPRQTMRL